MNFVTPMGLSTSFSILRDCIKLLELNDVFESTTIGEPNLGSRGLYELTNKWQKQPGVPNLLNLLMYSDGKSDLVRIMQLTNIGVDEIIDLVDISIKHGLLAKRKPKMRRFIQGKQPKGQ
jgi:aminopeptidase-like protein